jgi:very-short-patch-repair endonuclease
MAKTMRREMTPAERLLWQRLRNNQINGFHFRRQQIISGFIAGFYCHTAALVAEVDGPWHEPGYDQERDAILARYGISVLRFTNEDVLHKTEEVLTAITAFLAAIATQDTESV